MLLADLVATSGAVASTRSRLAKIAALAELLARAEPDEIAIAVGFLTGEPRQGRIGIGWATLAAIELSPVDAPTLTLSEIDAAVDAVEGTSGAGSVEARRALLTSVLVRATAPEAEFIRAHFTGGLRQGALEGVMLDAIARASEIALRGRAARRDAQRTISE